MIRAAAVCSNCSKVRSSNQSKVALICKYLKYIALFSKFVSILAGPLRSVIGLSDSEISQLADYFRAQDGRVLYHQLCQIIHGEDTGGRDKTSADCLLEACPPPPEPNCHKLDQWQLRRLCCLLATIADRELPLKPYFQDYELVAKNDGRITFAHFARLLNYIGVIVSPEDFNLLVRRFIKDSYTLDYVEFLKAVEAVKKEGVAGLGAEYKNPKAVIDTTLPKLSRPEVEAGLSTEPLGASEVFHPALTPPRPTRQLIDLMMRVQEYVLQRRIRASEFFRDYDPLNSGRIAPQQFRRAMDAMGLSTILSPQEVICVMRHYMDPNDNERICWRTFEDDCDQVFTVKELEKHPDVVPGAAAEALSELPPLGSAGDRGMGETERDLDLAQAALLRVRAACKERSIDLRPAFSEHDDHNNGHVSRAQVRRVLARMGVLPSAAQVRALEARYLDDCGFSYVRLLDELEERPVESATIAGPSTAPRKPQSSVVDPRETDIVQILAKIKGKMVREGIRPREFLRQFDKQNELVIPRADFYRGLATSGISLTPLEMNTLMEVFCAPGRRRCIEYDRFCCTVGEALTQGGLERAPLLEPVAHLPTIDSPLNYLNFEERNIVSGALAKLSKYPDQMSNILEVFQDIDKERCGTIPRISMERALCQRNLLALLSARERELLYKCFGYRRGCGDEVNYRALCNALDILYATASAQPC
ncbi:hypothetical protein K1T71_006424 [Dendrolimus kikuchii]|uniref:Uncharacterized protein n=1 Tax=Dendrolimus kikuchii TaxID=765133 RepID=A0ACC1D110_9NEOP|nr:hypothetical protein K1T71_006424 [Dendrolimus kikuchii]